jgi:site-specific DNA-methyltransferase (adenine-specific)
MTIICGDCLEEMRKMEDNSISGIVTDPPYGLGFMGKDWDAELPQHEIWSEALRIVKPGGHLLAFGGTRTYHRLTCAIEDAGWEIRDCIMWLYGSGFPKSHNHFGIESYGTSLKPAYEPIIMAMKPCDGTFKQNAAKWGQAGINIDGCRIGNEIVGWGGNGSNWFLGDRPPHHKALKSNEVGGRPVKGRWPANVILDEEAGEMLDEQSGHLKSGELKGFLEGRSNNEVYGKRASRRINQFSSNSGGASRFFYCAKASPSERNEGLEHLEDKVGGGMCSTVSGDTRTGHITVQKNNHPTVKPLKLMEYLIKLIMPPKDGILLDPFAGSGTTILAAHRLGMKAIGIEKQQEYCDIANARVAHYIQNNLKFG